MSRKNIIIVICAIIAILLVVWFVTPSREEKAKAQLDAIYKVEQSGQFDQAISQYEALIAEYESTQAAKLAADYIVRVNRYKDRLLEQEVRKNLERIALVLNGYREMMGTMPASIEQLDSGEYMFDSDYIAEIPFEGFMCYLRFEPVASSYTLFSLKDGAEKVIRFDASGKTTVMSKTEFDQEIGNVLQTGITKGRTVFLQSNAK